MSEIANETKSSGNLWFWVFSVIIVVMIARTFLTSGLDGWGSNLAEARQQASTDGKPVLLYFDAPG